MGGIDFQQPAEALMKRNRKKVQKYPSSVLATDGVTKAPAVRLQKQVYKGRSSTPLMLEKEPQHFA